MIEDKETGIKVAENPKEAMWGEVKRKIELEIETLGKSIEVNRAFLEKANEKLKDAEQSETRN